MGRPSKLTDKQWSNIEKLILAGEKVSPIARKYGITEAAIRKRINTKVTPLKAIANQLAKAELEFDSLPLSSKVKVRTLADELKDISVHLSGAARFGAMTAHRLSSMAHTESDKIDVVDPLKSIGTLKGIAVLNKMANESAGIGLNLMHTNKDTVSRLNEIETVPAISRITRRIVRVAD
jgi:predicted DNA-binding protein YlxM (UPF0122 family)